MVDESRERLPHILIKDTAVSNMYTRPLGGPGSPPNLPPRNRQNHAKYLIAQLAAIQEQEQEIVTHQKAIGLDAGWGHVYFLRE